MLTIDGIPQIKCRKEIRKPILKHEDFRHDRCDLPLGHPKECLNYYDTMTCGDLEHLMLVELFQKVTNGQGTRSDFRTARNWLDRQLK